MMRFVPHYKIYVIMMSMLLPLVNTYNPHVVIYPSKNMLHLKNLKSGELRQKKCMGSNIVLLDHL